MLRINHCWHPRYKQRTTYVHSRRSYRAYQKTFVTPLRSGYELHSISHVFPRNLFRKVCRTDIILPLLMLFLFLRKRAFSSRSLIQVACANRTNEYHGTAMDSCALGPPWVSCWGDGGMLYQGGNLRFYSTLCQLIVHLRCIPSRRSWSWRRIRQPKDHSLTM